MKTLLKTASAAALLAASANLAAAQDDALKIGMTFQEMNNPYFVSMQEALNEAAAQIGAEVIVTESPACSRNTSASSSGVSRRTDASARTSPTSDHHAS